MNRPLVVAIPSAIVADSTSRSLFTSKRHGWTLETGD
jgi:hypothetical protein